MDRVKNRFTIITPSFNQGEYISETINSVLDQEYNTIQYIIIDGGSTDNTIDVISKIEDGIDYWVSEKDNGQSHAINKGIARSEGEIINWLNSDDYYVSNKVLAEVHDAFGPKITCVAGKSNFFASSGILYQSRGTDVYPDNLAKTIGWARIDQPETFFRKEVWDKIGTLNESLQYCMDREWWMRYLYHYGLDGIKKIDSIWVNFRLHEESKTESQKEGFWKEHHSLFYQMGQVIGFVDACRLIQDSFDINEKLKTEISNWEDTDLVRRSFNYYLLITGNQLYASGKMKLSRKFLNMVRKSWLASEDSQLLLKLKFRTHLPSALVHFFRR